MTKPMTTECCNVPAYVDRVDGGTYCGICDSEVDPKSGRVLTEDERLRALCERELAQR
jgi:hypothetical protein